MAEVTISAETAANMTTFIKEAGSVREQVESGRTAMQKAASASVDAVINAGIIKPTAREELVSVLANSDLSDGIAKLAEMVIRTADRIRPASMGGQSDYQQTPKSDSRSESDRIWEEGMTAE